MDGLTIAYLKRDEIEALIGIGEESQFLEFKRGDVLDKISDEAVRNEIVRDVNGFANAGGGVIIFGLDEEKAQPGAIAKVKGLHPVTNQKVDRLRIEQIVRLGMEPIFTKFSVHEIDVGQAARVIVINVGKADTAHQCRSDQKYYQRVGVSRPPMHDHQIRDVMNRNAVARVILNHRLTAIKQLGELHVYGLDVSLTNEGRRTAKHWALEAIIPENCEQQVGVSTTVIERAKDKEYPNHRVFEYSCERAPLRMRTVLLPGQSICLGQSTGYDLLEIRVTHPIYLDICRQQAPIIYRLYVDDCSMAETIIPFDGWCRF